MSPGHALHRNSIVIDAVSPLLQEKKYIEWYKEGGVTAVAPTVAVYHNSGEALRDIAGWLSFVSKRDDLVLVSQASDIKRAKEEGKLGIFLHFQGTDPIEDDINLVDAFKATGVGMIQLTYNVKNRVGDGSIERTDSGLSHFGLRFVERCNDVGVIVDCSHTGYRTTLDAIEASTKPVVFSHANPKGVFDSPRNINDQQIRAVAATGGLVGVVGFPGFISDSKEPTLDQFIELIDYIVNLAGVDHVGLGVDYFPGQHLVATEIEAQAYYEKWINLGYFRPETYSPPPHRFPTGIETPRTLPNLTERLLERGYSSNDVQKILGQNWMRVFREVWG